MHGPRIVLGGGEYLTKDKNRDEDNARDKDGDKDKD
jgi:hypothetical protein